MQSNVRKSTGKIIIHRGCSARARELQVTCDLFSENCVRPAETVQLSDQGVTGLGDEESTAIGWLTAAVQKCARALDLARCLEGTLIGDGRALTI